jgi:hypothetical protein
MENAKDFLEIKKMMDNAFDNYRLAKSLEFETQEMCDAAISKSASNIEYIPDKFKTQEMCEMVVSKSPESVKYIPSRFKTMELCEKMIQYAFIRPFILEYVPEEFITQEVSYKLVDWEPINLRYIPDKFKTLKMCNKAVFENSFALSYVPEHLVTLEMCTRVFQDFGEGILTTFPEKFLTDEFKSHWEEETRKYEEEIKRSAYYY